MTRAEFLEAASERLSEAIILLTAAGEDCLAFELEAIADRVDLRAVPVAVKSRADDCEILRLTFADQVHQRVRPKPRAS